MSQVEESIEVRVPVHTAYNQWTQFESFPQFMDGVERIEQRTDTLTHWVTKIGGQAREFDAEITEQVPDERVAWTTVGGEARQAGVVTFHRIQDDTTKVMLQLDFDSLGRKADGNASKKGYRAGQIASAGLVSLAHG
ncbi:SRPBCC family protein, partial [Streptomyces massasporeus]|uniref:SRPBCC family protein n=1 Tax=Streptomyces massasporeus TaxID=67324 RepID=UPI0033D1BA86